MIPRGLALGWKISQAAICSRISKSLTSNTPTLHDLINSSQVRTPNILSSMTATLPSPFIHSRRAALYHVCQRELVWLTSTKHYSNPIGHSK